MVRIMNFSIVKVITILTPAKFLPTGTKAVIGKHIMLNTQERRELFERNITHYIHQFLNKYSPIKHMSKAYRMRRLRHMENDFFCLMGKIALTHAAMEQDLKNTLIVDWGTPEKIIHNEKQINLDSLYGQQLRKTFLKLLKNSFIPTEKYEEYKALCDEFWKLSKKRNDAIKAIYAFNHETGEVSKVHEKNHSKYDTSMSFEEIINSWIPKVDMTELKNLYQELINLKQKFMNLRYSIFSDKMKLTSELCSEIGKAYPASAFKNPYLYRASLEGN